MHVISFSLTPACKESLRERLAPYLHADYYENLDDIAAIIRETLPQEVMDELDRHGDGETVAPILIKNLPEVADIPANDINNPLIDFYMPMLSAGIYRAIGLDGSPVPLIRTSNKHQGAIAGGVIHTDIYDFSQLGVLRNEEHAATRFFDMREMRDVLPPEIRSRILIKSYSPVQKEGTLDEFLVPFKSQPRSYQAMDVDREKTDTEAQKAFDEAADRIGVDVDLQPGELVFWNNRKIYHQARLGAVKEAASPSTNRWAVNTSSYGR